MRFARPFAFALIASMIIFPRSEGAEAPFALEGGETIVFLGDSITQAGRYVVDVEAFLLTRFPDKAFTVINHGISSETVSGTSEPDHDPRRPDAHNRFARDVTAWRPDVLVACFGMNDGNYFPFEPTRFARYQAGINRLLDRARDEAKVERVTLLTPPPFDPYRRKASDPDATTYGYKFAFLGYDRVLGRFGEWLLTLPEQRPSLKVADVHSALNRHLAERRKSKVSYFLAGDAVHPNPTGHWLMAQTLLLAWNAPSEVAEVVIDAAGKNPPTDNVRDLTIDEEAGVTFTWRSPLPMPVDPECDPTTLAFEQVSERLNRYRLTIRGLTAPSYAVMAMGADGAEVKVGDLAREALESGIDLTTLRDFPTVDASRKVFDRLLKHRQSTYNAWREAMRSRDGSDASPSGPGEADRTEIAAIRELCRPMDVRVRLLPSTGISLSGGDKGGVDRPGR